MVATLLEGWGPLLEVVEVVAGTGGIFDIHIDDEHVFWKKMIGRYPEPDDLTAILTTHLGPRVT